MKNKFQFKIEQIAITPHKAWSEKALQLLAALGMTEWVRDNVVASGSVNGVGGKTNAAELAFNYQTGIPTAMEFEILNYVDGDNFVTNARQAGMLLPNGGIVTHLGMHVSMEQLSEVRRIMTSFDIETSQEVWTESHVNPKIKNSRRYNYVIFNTRILLGTDLKFIVRLPYTPTPEEQAEIDAAAAPKPSYNERVIRDGSEDANSSATTAIAAD